MAHRSTVPFGLLTSMWIHVWGLIHSILVTVPRSLIGLFRVELRRKHMMSRCRNRSQHDERGARRKQGDAHGTYLNSMIVVSPRRRGRR